MKSVLIEKEDGFSLVLKTLSTDGFFKKYSIGKEDVSEVINKNLVYALSKRDEVYLESILLIGFKFGFSKIQNEILSELLFCDWHYSHEDIVSIMDGFHCNKNAQHFYNICFCEFEYLDYDESFNLARKAIYGLVHLNTIDSVNYLNLLVSHKNLIISQYSKKAIGLL